MSEFRVASRYAKALIDLGIEQNILDQLKDDMQCFIKVLRENTALQAVLKNPVIKSDKKTAILSALFADKFSVALIKFFKIMVDKGRAGVLYATAREFVQEYNSYNKIVSAKVTSASPLSEESRATILSLIKESTGGNEVQLENSVKPELIGGFIITIGDKQVDTSILGKLNKLELVLEA